MERKMGRDDEERERVRPRKRDDTAGRLGGLSRAVIALKGEKERVRVLVKGVPSGLGVTEGGLGIRRLQ